MTVKYKLTDQMIDRAIEIAARKLYEYCRKANMHNVVLGESGGLDSAVTTGIAAVASNIAKADGHTLNVVTVMMPCESSPEAERLARQVIERFNCEAIKVELTDIFQVLYGTYPWKSTLEHYVGESAWEELLAELPKSPIASVDRQVKEILTRTGCQVELDEWEWSKKIAQGNIKARLRMIMVYHIARMMKGMVLSTDNLSEFWMAFWTICGDVGDYGMIQKVLKGLEMYDFARRLRVPEEVIVAKPDDGLNVGKGDADQLGATYPVIDEIMIKLIQVGFDPDGEMAQLKDLPIIDDFPYELVYSLAERALKGAFKRRGTFNLEREDLGLPHLEDIVL